MNVEGDGKVEYEEVPLTMTKRLDGLLGTGALDYACLACAKNIVALKRTNFASFPEVLVIHAKEFQLVNWVPAKLDIPTILPKDNLLEFTEAHLGTGLKESEEPLPDDTENASAGGEEEGAVCQAALELGWSSCR
ncbi:hypothetical protein D9611_013210 [Ephemerocybe angulata]|uniref:Uncharacterized protein n=1 Tax=Ephemerocybe angulata TaxID=980116 RepID=A0A8H5BTY7_9AGAR|nr:hypothetical protein D9611_013210 [Tulosesus angulatus]